MKTLAERLAASQFSELEPYQSARRIGGSGQVYLNANELPFGAYSMPPNETWQRYPDFLPADLSKRYASYAGVDPAKVLAVRGADEGIDLLIRSFCEPQKDSIRIQTPTYSMYEFIASAHQIKTNRIPLTENYELALDKNLKPVEHLKLVFICNPNNPTGNLLSTQGILTIADAYKDTALVIVDEAYSEFCPQGSLADNLTSYPNLVILRTLSKAFGLAAVRLGFVMADQSVLSILNTLIAPYPIPDPCARIGLEALSTEGLAYMKEQRVKIIDLRNHYMTEIDAISAVESIYPSVANFFLVKFRDSQWAFEQLQAQGIILRDQNNIQSLENHLRISVGSESEMSQLLKLLQQWG